MADEAPRKKGVDLKNPGNKEYVIFAGGALGLGLIYVVLKGKGKPTTPTTPTQPTATGATGATGGNLLPGGQSLTGNAFTDAVAGATGTATGAVSRVTSKASPVPALHVAQGAHSILGTTSGGGGGGAGGGISGGTSPGGSASSSFAGTTPLAWATGVLNAGGFPKTAANLQSLVAWALLEGGGGANNPLNTTQPATGATTFNSVGVKNYPNQATGIAATIATLGNGLYSNIVAGLKSGAGIGSNAASELSKWSGGGYSSLAGTYARAGSLIQAPKVTAKPAAGTKAASGKTVAGLFPVVAPRTKPVALRTKAPAKPAPRVRVAPYAGSGIYRAIVAAFKPRPRPRFVVAPRQARGGMRF